MRAFLIWVASAIAIGVAVQYAAIWAMPRIIMDRAIEKIADSKDPNQFIHAKRPTFGSRTVVRPSPDLSYSACVLDLSEGPVRITARSSEPYSSLSVFSDITDNVFVENADQVQAGKFDIIVTNERAAPPDVPGVKIVKLPSNRGLALIRRVVESDEHFRSLEPLKAESICAPVK